MLPQRPGSDTEIRAIAATVWRFKWSVIAVTLLTAAAAFAITNRQVELYEATSLVLVRAPATADVIGEGSANPQEAARDLAAELAFIQSDNVREAISERLGGPARITARTQADADVIAFRAEGTSPARVADMANTAAEVYTELQAERIATDYADATSIVTEQIDDLVAQQEALSEPVEAFRASLDPNAVNEFGIPVYSETQISAYTAELERLESAVESDLQRLETSETALRNTLSDLRIGSELLEDGTAEVISRARVPAEPYSPELEKNVLVGLVAGLLLGLALAFLRDYLDGSVRTAADIESASHVRVLGVVPRVKSWRKRTPAQLADLANEDPLAAESYRSAWSSLRFLNDITPMRTILVTSPLQGDGKTTTAANLSVTMANSGSNVLLIDGDLRRPGLHTAFGLENNVGLTSILKTDLLPPSVFRAVPGVPNLRVVTSGPVSADSAARLSHERIQSVIANLSEWYEFVVIDSPPVLPVSDAAILSRAANGVVLVARAGETSAHDIQASMTTLNDVDAQIVGVVLNAASKSSMYRYGEGS